MDKNKLNFFKENKIEVEIFIRYMVLFFLINFFLTDFFVDFLVEIFTIFAFYFLKLFVGVELVEGVLLLSTNDRFLIVPECIAPNAYMLISILLLSIPVNLSKLSRIFLKSLFWFSVFNLIRILFLMWIHLTFGLYYFEKVHLLFYELLSGLFTALIVVYYLKKEKIKKVFPIFSDLKYLFSKFKKD